MCIFADVMPMPLFNCTVGGTLCKVFFMKGINSNNIVLYTFLDA